MPPPEANHSVAIGSEKCSTAAEAQGKDLKTVIIKTFKDPKEDVNTCLKEEQENTKKQLNEIMKSIQEEFNKAIKSPKKSHTEIKLERKDSAS